MVGERHRIPMCEWVENTGGCGGGKIDVERVVNALGAGVRGLHIRDVFCSLRILQCEDVSV